MDARDTLKYTIGVDIVAEMLDLHAKATTKFAVGGARGASESNKQQVIKLGIEKDLHSKSQM